MQTRASIPVTLCLLVAACGPLPDVDWPVNGGVDNIRYSPLSEITRDNVGQLRVAWTYDSQDAFEGSEMQSNPIVVDGVLFATTPTLKVVALNAETGTLLWSFDPIAAGKSAASWRHGSRRPGVRRRPQLSLGARQANGPAHCLVRTGGANRPSGGVRPTSQDAER